MINQCHSWNWLSYVFHDRFYLYLFNMVYILVYSQVYLQVTLRILLFKLYNVDMKHVNFFLKNVKLERFIVIILMILWYWIDGIIVIKCQVLTLLNWDHSNILQKVENSDSIEFQKFIIIIIIHFSIHAIGFSGSRYFFTKWMGLL